jgi:surface protein
MFDGCSKLVTPSFFNLNTKNMTYMFQGCTSLKSVPDYDTSQVTDMANVLYNSGLEIMPNWNTSKVQNFNYAFYKTQIEEAVVNTDSATNIAYIFQYCEKLKKAEISSMDKITSSYCAGSYAQKCYNLRQFIIRNATKLPIFYNSQYSYPFTECHHFEGTFHQTYNPEGLQDGGIYVPDEWVEPMKAATGWSIYGDIIYPLSQLPESYEPTIPYVTKIERYNTSYATWTMLKDGSRYYYSDTFQPLSKFTFVVPENTTSTTLTYEVEITGTGTQLPWTVLFGKLDTVVGNYVTPELCQDFRDRPEAQTYTVTYTDLTPGEHFIYIGANQRTSSSAATQYLKFRRVYE